MVLHSASPRARGQVHVIRRSSVPHGVRLARGIGNPIVPQPPPPLRLKPRSRTRTQHQTHYAATSKTQCRLRGPSGDRESLYATDFSFRWKFADFGRVFHPPAAPTPYGLRRLAGSQRRRKLDGADVAAVGAAEARDVAQGEAADPRSGRCRRSAEPQSAAAHRPPLQARLLR